jgi:hypothetical protein
VVLRSALLYQGLLDSEFIAELIHALERSISNYAEVVDEVGGRLAGTAKRELRKQLKKHLPASLDTVSFDTSQSLLSA